MPSERQASRPAVSRLPTPPRGSRSSSSTPGAKTRSPSLRVRTARCRAPWSPGPGLDRPAPGSVCLIGFETATRPSPLPRPGRTPRCPGHRQPRQRDLARGPARDGPDADAQWRGSHSPDRQRRWQAARMLQALRVRPSSSRWATMALILDDAGRPMCRAHGRSMDATGAGDVFNGIWLRSWRPARGCVPLREWLSPGRVCRHAAQVLSGHTDRDEVALCSTPNGSWLR